MPNNIIDELSIKISAEATTAVNALNSVVLKLGQLSTKLGSLSGIRVTSFITPAAIRQITAFGTAINGLNLAKAQAFATTISSISSLGGGLSLHVSGARAFTTLADGIDAINVAKLRAIAAIDFSNMRVLANTAERIRGLSGELSRLQNLTEKAERAQKKLELSLQKTKKTTTSSTNTFNKHNGVLAKFLASVKRIAYYRAIRAALRAFTQGLSEGIENLYYWSQAWDTSFAPKMDQLATAQLYLKNGFSSMFAPLIEYAIPIIDRVIDKLVDMFNVAQELFAKLTGAPTWNKAIKYPVTYKDALDDAAGSAKALQNILMDFDELNVINTPKSGSRGKAGDEKDYAAMFQLIETATGNNPLGKFGAIFADMGDKVERFVAIIKKFTDFFKGLNFKPLGDSLERFWGVVSPIIDEFIEDFEWFEEKVLEPITKFLVEKGIPAAIDTLTAAISALWSIIKPIKDGLKEFWDQNGDWIMDLFEQISMQSFDGLKEVFTTIQKFFDKHGNKIRTIFSNLATVFQKLEPFIKKIAGMMGTAAWSTFISSIETVLDLLGPILDAVAGVSEILGAIFLGVDKDGKKVKSGFEMIGESILNMFLAPLKLVMRALAVIIDVLAWMFPNHKEEWHNLAEEIRHSADALGDLNDTIEITNEDIFATGDVTTSTGKVVSRELDAANQSWAKTIEAIRELGPTSEKESRQLTEWIQYCEKYGLDPLTGKIKGVNYGLEDTGDSAKKGMKAVTDQSGKAAKDLTDQFTSALSPNAGFVLGQGFGNAVQKGINPSGIGWNLGAQMAQSAQNALNASPLQLKATINATITGVNANDKWAAALAAAGVSTAGFHAQGGFPSPASLFWAGENGVPEMLGTVGGRTAVASGMEITGIRDAVYESGQRQENLLRTLINAVNSKDLTLVANSATGRWVNKALKSYAGVTG